jgi:hypothetical protein
LEFHALQSFSLDRSRAASRRPLAFLPFTTTAESTGACAGGLQSSRHGRPNRRGQSVASRRCSPVRVRCDDRRPFGRRFARCSPGLRASSGCPSRLRADVLPHGSSHELPVGVRGRS